MQNKAQKLGQVWGSLFLVVSLATAARAQGWSINEAPGQYNAPTTPVGSYWNQTYQVAPARVGGFFTPYQQPAQMPGMVAPMPQGNYPTYLPQR